MVGEQKVRETERGGNGGDSGPRRLCRARVRGVLGYSVCVRVHVSQFFNGKSKVLKLKGSTQTNSRDVGTLLMSEPFNTTRRNVPDREMRGGERKGRRSGMREEKGKRVCRSSACITSQEFASSAGPDFQASL